MQQILLSFLYALSLSFCIACGNLSNFHSNQHRPVMIEQHQRLFISSSLCNEQQCLPADSELHQKLVLAMQQQLQQQGMALTSDPAQAEFHLRLISAYEESIDKEHPRNLYLIMLNKRGEEVAQFGLAEDFSTPLVGPYMAYAPIEENFKQLFSATLQKVVTLAHKR